MADIIDETWFIGVMAGVGAVVFILVIIVIVLCCLWFRKAKQTDQEVGFHNNNSNRANIDENWTLAHPDEKASSTSSSDTSRIVQEKAAVSTAGSSLIQMDKEMRASVNISTQTSFNKTKMQRALEGKRYVDAFTQGDNVGRGQVDNSSSRFTRSDLRGSKQKPRMNIVSVSTTNNNESSYNSPVASPCAYRIPSEDYDNEDMVMYFTDDRRTRGRMSSNASEVSKVREMATNYEKRESTVSSTPSRMEVENEIRELKGAERTAPIKKRLSNHFPANSAHQKRASSYVNEDFDEDEEHEINRPRLASWQIKSGKSTIETRVDRYKKAGAVSVFPD